MYRIRSRRDQIKLRLLPSRVRNRENMLWEAFRYKQNLYPSKDARCYKETSSTMELSEEERRKIFSFAEGIDRKAPAKAQIEKNEE